MYHICLVSQEYPEETDFGGIATYTYYLSKGLAKVGHNVSVICRSYIKDDIKNNGKINIYRICEEDEILYRKKISELIYKLHGTKKIDLIESAEWGADLVDYYTRYKNLLNIPVIIRLHTPFFIWKKYNQIVDKVFLEKERYIEEWEKQVICRADLVTACSDSIKNLVSNEYRLDVNSIVTIPNMIDIEDIDKNVESDEQTIYYIGSIEQRKGVLILAEAYKIIKKQIPTVRLFFVGRDTCRNDRGISTKKYIEEILKDVQGYQFIEHVANKEIRKYMLKAQVLVFPSLYENFPYVILEAMACGKAIIGGSNGGIPEIIEDKINGLLYDPPQYKQLASLIVSLLENKEYIDRLGKNAKERVENFSIDKVLKEQLRIYEGLIRRHL